MKDSVHHTVTLLSCLTLICTHTVNDRNKLKAVSPVEIATALYLRVRHQRSHLDFLPAIDPNTKKRICHYITGSGLFRVVNGESRVYMHKIYRRLRKEKASLYERLYQPAPNSTFRSIKVYTNQTRPVKVNVESQREFQEDAFICLTSMSLAFDGVHHEDSFHHYFISEEFNVSDDLDSYVPGRFIFEPSFDNNLASGRVHNVAEVPAEVLSAPGEDVELSYLVDREEREPAETQAADPMCSLDDLQRLRVCTLVLSANYFEREVTFAPRLEVIDSSEEISGCFKMTISFRDERANFKANREVYKEWMFACRPDEYYADYQAEYYISRVYNASNEVFVYRWDENGDRRMFLENRFGNIRFKI